MQQMGDAVIIKTEEVLVREMDMANGAIPLGKFVLSLEAFKSPETR